jgi:hypothetical protein
MSADPTRLNIERAREALARASWMMWRRLCGRRVRPTSLALRNTRLAPKRSATAPTTSAPPYAPGWAWAKRLAAP